MIRMIVADNINYKLWEYDIKEIEKDMQSLLERWGCKIKSKEEATDFIKRLYEAMENKTHKQYKMWEHTSEKMIEEYRENNK